MEMTRSISQGYPLWVAWIAGRDLPEDGNDSGTVQVMGEFDPDTGDFQTMVSKALKNCGRVVGWDLYEDGGMRPIVAKDGRVDGAEDLLDDISTGIVFYADSRRTAVLRMMDHVYGVNGGGKLPDGWQDIITSIVLY